MKNKTYIAFDGDNDIRYYWLMKAWKHNKSDFFQEFNFYDAHDTNSTRDSSQEETIKRRLKERFDETKHFILLVGESTRSLYKFVRWEIQQAIERDIPITVVNINGTRFQDQDRCPPILKEELAMHISFNQKIIEHSIKNWPNQDSNLRKEGTKGAYYYPDKVYKELNL